MKIKLDLVITNYRVYTSKSFTGCPSKKSYKGYLKPFYTSIKKYQSHISNEVIVYRVMVYANPSLIVQAMHFTSKGQSLY